MKDLISSLVGKMQDYAREFGQMSSRREVTKQTRFCLWDGQDDSGKKLGSVMGKKPFPFEGASDSRVRVADKIVNFRVAFLVAAAKRAELSVSAMESGDSRLAVKLQTVLRWVLRNKLGRKWRAEVRKLAQYVEGTEPACALMQVGWEQRNVLALETFGIGEVMREIEARAQMDGMEMQPVDHERILILLTEDRGEIADAVVVVKRVFPSLTDVELRRVVKELRDVGEASVPVFRMGVNTPTVRALRVYDGAWMRLDVEDMDSVEVVAQAEWLTETQVNGRVSEMGYSEAFAKEVVKYKGRSLFGVENKTFEQTAAAVVMEKHKEDVEVITAFRRECVNGVERIKMTVFSGFVGDVLGKDEVLPYKHGKFPFVEFVRERLGNSLMDSRSTAYMLMTDQAALKRQRDSFSDHTALKTVPSVFTPHNRPNAELIFGPLSKIPRRTVNDYEFVRLPDYPKESLDERAMLLQDIGEYFGYPFPGVDKELIRLVLQDMTDEFLDSLADVMGMLLQLAQQYLTDEELSRITGDDQVPVARSVDEIQGQFNIMASFDVRYMDNAFVKDMAKVMNEMVIPMDTAGVVKHDRLVNRMLMAIDPSMAADVLEPIEAATDGMRNDERNKFAQIFAGIEPPLPDTGHGVRLDELRQTIEKNPDSVMRMGDKERDILENRMKGLEFAVTQRENAAIGRQGVKPVLE